MRKFIWTVLLITPIFLQISCMRASKEIIPARPATMDVINKVPAPSDDNKNTLLATDFRLADLSGRFYKLSDYKDKQAVLLFFWTTWCPYCQAELKGLSARSEELTGEGIEILTINVGESRLRVERFLQGRYPKIKFLVDEDAAVSYAYELLGVPTFYLIDKQGRVVFQEHVFPLNYKKLIQR